MIGHEVGLGTPFMSEVTLHSTNRKIGQTSREEDHFMHDCITPLSGDCSRCGATGTEDDFSTSRCRDCRYASAQLGRSNFGHSIKEEFTLSIGGICFSTEDTDLYRTPKVDSAKGLLATTIEVVASILGHAQNLSGRTG